MRNASTARSIRRDQLTLQDLVSAAADVSEGEVGAIVQAMFQRGLIRFARPQPPFECVVARQRTLGVVRRTPPRRFEGRSSL
jgi:hypothetical protein